MTPTYGNTLMGLAASPPSGPHNDYKITYYAPEPRAVLEVVDLDDRTKTVEYGQTGRVKLTTLTKEFFMPGFLERDEGEREPPMRAVSVGRRERGASLSVASRPPPPSASIDMLTSTLPGSIMLNLPILRWGKPYSSMDVDPVEHFATGERIAMVSRANAGLIQRDMRQAARAREVLREIGIEELCERAGVAGDRYLNGALAMGDETQTPD